MGYRLVSVKVKGFRGFPEQAGEIEFQFDTSCTLLYGIQGAGKSSTLNAIEWCLFGAEVANKSATRIEERKGWIIKNKQSNEASVEVTFEQDGELLKVFRSDRKRRGKSQFYYQLNDGSQQEDETGLRVLLGVELTDYMSCVYLHQEVINALLVQEPRERQNALDRLMGLTNWRNLLAGIKSAKAADEFKKISAEFDVIAGKIDTAKKLKQRELEQAEDAANDHNIARRELSLEGAEARCQGVTQAVARFANDYGLMLSSLPPCQTYEDLEPFCIITKQAVRKLRSEQPDAERQKELLNQQTELNRLKANLESKQNAEKQLAAEIDQLRQKQGTPSALAQKKQLIDTEQLPAAKNRLNTINNRAGVIRETLKLLETAQREQTQNCPVCENEIDSVQIQHQLRTWQQEMHSELSPIEAEIRQLEAEQQSLQKIIKKFEQLQRDIEAKREEVRDATKAISIALETEILDSALDPLVLVNHAIAEVDRELAAIRAAVEQSNQRLDNIDDQLEDIKRIITVLRRRQESEEMLKVQTSPQYKQVIAARDQLQNFCDQVVTVGEAIDGVLKTTAAEKINETKTAISSIYTQLSGRQDFPDIEIDPEKYEVMAVGKEESEVALRILNKGDINCAALSIFLALATSDDLTHNIGFMVLDDPSQNLDPAHKIKLASVLNHVLEKKQLVIATSEEDFAHHLNSELTQPKKVYRMERWSEYTGPEIQVE